MEFGDSPIEEFSQSFTLDCLDPRDKNLMQKDYLKTMNDTTIEEIKEK